MAEDRAGRVVVVGTGHAGVQTGNALRRFGWTGPIVLVGAENALPYQRPPLSKEILHPDSGPGAVVFHHSDHYRDQGIDLVLGEQVVALDVDGNAVRLASGRVLGYDVLVLALGARPRALRAHGMDLDGVVELRSMATAVDLRERMSRAKSIVLAGGGFIGLELASAASAAGLTVTVVEAAPRVLPGVVTPVTRDFLVRRHEAAGVAFRVGDGIAGLSGVDGRVRTAHTTGGAELDADLVVVGIGAVPNDELARGAGLAIDGGIVVDGGLATSHPRIYAVGDCAAFPHDGRSIRISSVQHAFDSATYLARRLTGTAAADTYVPTPLFWTDQVGVKVQMIGLPTGQPERLVVDGDVEAGRFSVERYLGDAFVGGEAVGLPKAHLAMRRRLASV